MCREMIRKGEKQRQYLLETHCWLCTLEYIYGHPPRRNYLLLYGHPQRTVRHPTGQLTQPPSRHCQAAAMKTSHWMDGANSLAQAQPHCGNSATNPGSPDSDTQTHRRGQNSRSPGATTEEGIPAPVLPLTSLVTLVKPLKASGLNSLPFHAP